MPHPPVCPHRPACDGCPLIEQPGWAMRLAKSARLYAGIAPLERELGPIPRRPLLGAPTRRGWRHRARMVVNPSARTPDELLGFYQAGSRQLLPIQTCLVHHPTLEALLARARPALLSRPALVARARFVAARLSPDGAHATWTLCIDRPEDPGELDQIEAAATQLADELRGAHPELELGVHLDVGVRGHSILSGQLHPLRGPTALPWSLGGRALSVPLKAFSQVDPAQLERVHEQMRQWLGEPPARLLDLYGGVGAHGLALVASGGHILLVDVDEQAVEAARVNAQALGLEMTARAGRDDEVLDWLSEQVGEPPRPVIVNPARAGLHHELVAWLCEQAPPALLYLSCEPRTLRRDLARLGRGGMRLEQLQGVDLMPNTTQVEALALCRPGASSAPAGDPVDHAYWPAQGRRWAPGTSGVRAAPAQRSRWLAVVAGQAPRHGQLPHYEAWSPGAHIVCDRIGRMGRHSVIEARAEGLGEDAELRQRLRAWGHPVLGDDDFGDRGVNRQARRHMHLDRAALHCLEAGEYFAPLPAELAHWWPEGARGEPPG